ncbi:MAG TPA: hypothetical protein VM054_03440 [bacterium]|nr:hypothetical protein [bacterium]
MKFLGVVCVSLLFFASLATAGTLVFQPGGDEGKDAEIDNKQGGTPHGHYPYVLLPMGG